MRVWENWFTTRSQWSLGRTTTTTSNTITPVSAANIEHTHNSFRRSMHVLFVGMDCCDDEWCWCRTRNIRHSRHSEEEEIAYGTMADASCAKFTMRLNQNDKCLLWRLWYAERQFLFIPLDDSNRHFAISLSVTPQPAHIQRKQNETCKWFASIPNAINF